MGGWRRASGIALGIGVACVLTLASTLVAAKATIEDLEPTGPQPQVVLTDGGKPEPLYRASHALLISAANYQGVSKGGWELLPATAREMDDLAGALRNHGFSVRRVSGVPSKCRRLCVSSVSPSVSAWAARDSPLGRRPGHGLQRGLAQESRAGHVVGAGPRVDALDQVCRQADVQAHRPRIDAVQIHLGQ